MKIEQLLETSTTSGCVAPVVKSMGTQKRGAGTLFKGKKTSKPFYEEAVIEGEINEEDVVLAPGKGRQYKPGLLAKPEPTNPTDVVKLDIPLLIRLLEYAREDASNDMDLHDLAEKLVARGSRGRTLTMKDYDRVVEGVIAAGGVGESSSVDEVDQLAQISDKALDDAYHYGRSQPGNTFGWQANLKSAEFAKRMIDSGITDIEKISDAIHKGWNITANAFVRNPEQFGDTEKLRAAGKLDAKLQQRAKLMNIGYSQLPNDEQEKDRVVARALLQAIKGQRGVTEGKKVDRMVKHIEKSEKKLGKSKKDAGNIAWATANKRGYLDNKNKKKKANESIDDKLKTFESILMDEEDGISQEDLADLLLHRLESRYPDVVSRCNSDVLSSAISNTASLHAGATELGTSDIGHMLRSILRDIERINEDSTEPVLTRQDKEKIIELIRQYRNSYSSLADARRCLTAKYLASKKKKTNEAQMQLHRVVVPPNATPELKAHLQTHYGKKVYDPAEHEKPVKPPKVPTVKKPKPRREPKERIPRFKSDTPRTPLEKKAQDAMWEVWNAIAPDVMQAYGSSFSNGILNPYHLAEICVDANHMQRFANLSPEEENEILKLDNRTLARLVSKFGF